MLMGSSITGYNFFAEVVWLCLWICIEPQHVSVLGVFDDVSAVFQFGKITFCLEGDTEQKNILLRTSNA